jgi:hypothetical protein
MREWDRGRESEREREGEGEGEGEREREVERCGGEGRSYAHNENRDKMQ